MVRKKLKKVSLSQPPETPQSSEPGTPVEIPVPTPAVEVQDSGEAGKEPDPSLPRDATAIPPTLTDPEIEPTLQVDTPNDKVEGADNKSEAPAPEQQSWESWNSWGDAWVGGVSQWREECEDRWSQWQWPPAGWRPQSWHRASWDEGSQYYKYNCEGTPKEVATPHSWAPETEKGQDSAISRSGSDVSVVLMAEQLNRCNTGDVRLDLSPQLEDAKREEEAQEGPTLQERMAEKGEKLKEDQVAAAAQAAEAKKSGDQAVQKEAEEAAKAAKKKAEAHARYMRYYRNVRSLLLSQKVQFSRKVSVHVFHPLPEILRHQQRSEGWPRLRMVAAGTGCWYILFKFA